MTDRSRREFLADSARMFAAGFGGMLALQGCGDSGGSGLILPPGPLFRPTTYQVKLGSERILGILDQGTGKEVSGDLILKPPRPVQIGDDLGIGFEFSETLPATDEADPRRYVSVQFPGFYIFAGRVDRHPLRPCVNEDVTHLHITLKRSKNTDDRQAWSHLHLGTYRSGGRKCFVLFDNLHPWICFKTCSPTQGELKRILQLAIAAALVAAGIGVAAWIVGSAATVLATALFGIVIAF